MISLTVDPVFLKSPCPRPALAWRPAPSLFGRSCAARRRALETEVADLQTQIKNQDAVALERDSAFEVATARLAKEFSEMSQQSLQSNSETFLRLAEQNLGTHQEKAKRELSEREKAVEELVKPIRESLQASQKQITELENARSEAYGGIKSQLEAMQINQKIAATGNQEPRKCAATPGSPRPLGRNYAAPAG